MDYHHNRLLLLLILRRPPRCSPLARRRTTDSIIHPLTTQESHIQLANVRKRTLAYVGLRRACEAVSQDGAGSFTRPDLYPRAGRVPPVPTSNADSRYYERFSGSASKEGRHVMVG